MRDAAPIVKATRKSVTLFKPLEMRTSADRDESYPRIRRVTATRVYVCACVRACVRACACVCVCVCARARPHKSIYACGSGREVPSFRLFFVSCITRAHVHTHTPTSVSASEKNVHASVRLYCVARLCPGRMN